MDNKVNRFFKVNNINTDDIKYVIHENKKTAVFLIEGKSIEPGIPMKHIYENIMYAELNTKSDYCMACGYDGEIQIEKDENGKLIWVCPNCGNKNQDMMSVARRTCGYIGTQFWNQGRTQEIKERVLHL